MAGFVPRSHAGVGLDSGNEAVNNLVTLAGLLSVEDLSRKL